MRKLKPIKRHAMLFIFPQISTNGLVSFESAFKLHIPTSFPRRTGPFVPLIAPLWADFNFRDAGRIYYRVTNDSSTLDTVAEAISGKNDLYTEYKPTLAVVVTWFQSQPLGTDTAVSDWKGALSPFSIILPACSARLGHSSLISCFSNADVP